MLWFVGGAGVGQGVVRGCGAGQIIEGKRRRRREEGSPSLFLCGLLCMRRRARGNPAGPRAPRRIRLLTRPPRRLWVIVD